MKIVCDGKKLLVEVVLKDSGISSEIVVNGEIGECIKVDEDG